MRWWGFLLPAAGFLLAAPAAADRDEAIVALRKAELAFARSRPREARAELLTAIREDPSFIAAHLLQARVYLQLRDGVAAEAEVARAREAGAAAAATRHLMAHALLLQGQAERALREADPARVPRAFAAYAARVRGRSFQMLGDREEASREFGLALRLAPRDVALWVDLARFRLATGDELGALQAADRAVGLGPRNPEALLLRGELTRTQYGLAAALPWFDRVLGIDPQHVPAMLARAATLGELGRTRAMLALTRKALALEERNPTAFTLQAVLAARAGNFPLARALLQRTGGALDDQPAVMLLTGAVEHQLGNSEQAIERLSRLIDLQPGNLRARRLLAAAQWRAGDVRGTIETLRPIADLPEPDSYALTLMGRAYERLGDRLTAAHYFDRAMLPWRSDPAPAADAQLIEVLARRGAGSDLVRLLMRSGRAADALPYALAVRQANPGAAGPLMLTGDVLAALGRHREAADAYRQAANIRFTEPVALRLVEALRDAGQRGAAAEALSLFLGQNPRSIAGQLLAAQFMMDAGQFGRAADLIEVVRGRIGDSDAALFNNLAWASFRAGRTGAALAAAERAYALAPGNPAVAHSYGWLLFEARGNPARALSLLRQAVAQAPHNPEAQRHLAEASVILLSRSS